MELRSPVDGTFQKGLVTRRPASNLQCPQTKPVRGSGSFMKSLLAPFSLVWRNLPRTCSPETATQLHRPPLSARDVSQVLSWQCWSQESLATTLLWL